MIAKIKKSKSIIKKFLIDFYSIFYQNTKYLGHGCSIVFFQSVVSNLLMFFGCIYHVNFVEDAIYNVFDLNNIWGLMTVFYFMSAWFFARQLWTKKNPIRKINQGIYIFIQGVWWYTGLAPFFFLGLDASLGYLMIIEHALSLTVVYATSNWCGHKLRIENGRPRPD